MKKLIPIFICGLLHAEPALYKVVDLSPGPDAGTYAVRDSNDPPDIANDACRGTELWLRYAPPGTFMMGSPDDEPGRFINEELHPVTLTSGFYIGVFEVTQKQYELVTGQNPSEHKDGARPVEKVAWEDIRGSLKIAEWPANDNLEDDAFMDRLRKRTGLHFDLPLEAQWEYACRAGNTAAFGNGAVLGAETDEETPAMANIGRYRFNPNDERGGFAQHTRVGSYEPNAWGLYDMHGNVAEWCKDAYYEYPRDHSALTDPIGGGFGVFRIVRGGHWLSAPRICRSANREHIPSIMRAPNYGFRAAYTINPPAPKPPKTEEPAAGEAAE